MPTSPTTPTAGVKSRHGWPFATTVDAVPIHAAGGWSIASEPQFMFPSSSAASSGIQMGWPLGVDAVWFEAVGAWFATRTLTQASLHQADRSQMRYLNPWPPGYPNSGT